MNLGKLPALLRWPEWGGKKQGPLFAVAYLTAWQSPETTGSAVLVTLAVLAALCHAYLLNAVSDKDEDLATGKLKPFATQSRQHQRLVLLALPLLAMLPLLVATRWLALLGVGLIFTAGWIYSGRPRLRDRPVAGTIVGGLGQRTAPLLAFLGLLQLPEAAWLALHLAFLGSGLRGMLVHQFIDREADRRSGHRTVALAMSEHRMRQLLTAIAWVELGGLVVTGLWCVPIAVSLMLALLARFAGHRIWRSWTWYQRATDYANLPLNHLYFFFLPVTCAAFAAASSGLSGGLWTTAVLVTVFVAELVYRWPVLKGVVAVARLSLKIDMTRGLTA